MTAIRAVAIDLDVLGDTRALWRDWLASVEPVLALDGAGLSEDRGDAAAELDRLGAGNWRALLERFAEDRAPVYLRRDAETSAALRSLAARGIAVGVFTDAPEPLARIALAQLGAERRIVTLEAGPRALERLLGTLGAGAPIVRSRGDLVELAA